ncbi:MULTISPECIES: NAD(P)-dependent oxidoreductase [Pseudonocardia]|uniref:Tartronate semialdehyde reductase n=2 Tax=Pseudonocardia TaxID=1847 RepID=A0A1Y2MU71_PSEAH|nr:MULTISPECIES: NAD(P)-binding domain-containing protein [Pseudonocardia]OSY38327.1 tartronate semialdehyde reductase [Pseudonocardia autotrophica]TDN72628.1 3-hydroxyisobutyrate dehydrogenase-like beta-hydroxyacid dehydrogenase [Pseudonocardia autotrophica]BBG03337.1 6-phosphogluconate dehydrogenase [Pseudonocardia autotrophica]GEC24595.1 6-phosphogluconate dehydrogenase [Pseudonocardia saturnea]
MTAVTVIGLGPMGRAMVGALLGAGHRVTVWNRTPSRAEQVVADGAVLAPTPSDALRASPLIILSLTDYRAMYDVLGEATDDLHGRTVVNLSSEGPSGTRDAARWIAGQGAQFVVGGVMVPPPMVGTPAASVFYSGDAESFEHYRQVLATIGEPHRLGDDPALAQLMYLAHLDVFLTGLSALAHGTALLGTAGLPASEVMPGLLAMLAATPDMVAAGDAPWTQIDTGHHPGDLSTATMMGATADHVVAASEEAGIDLALPRAVQAHYRRAIDDGHGAQSWTRIVDGIRAPH